MRATKSIPNPSCCIPPLHEPLIIAGRVLKPPKKKGQQVTVSLLIIRPELVAVDYGSKPTQQGEKRGNTASEMSRKGFVFTA